MKPRPFVFISIALAWVQVGRTGEMPNLLSPASREVDVRRDATVAAVDRVMPSVVNIATATIVRIRDPFEDVWSQFFGPYHNRREPGYGYSLGSGVMIDEQGYVLTNDHVVRRADKVWVRTATSTNEYEAEIVATDSRADVAVLKLKAKPGERFPAIQFAPDDDLLLGETVLSLGNPFGLGLSVSRGILSSKSRIPPKETDQLDIPNWLQTDASVNPGSSGGPLVNLRGEMIGLNVAILANAQGIGFAIPAKRVAEALSMMITPTADGERLWFGARVKAGNGPLAVTSIQAESPASKAGLKNGDIIVEVNGRRPNGFMAFNDLLAGGAKHEAALTVLRDGTRRTIPVKLAAEGSFFNADLIQKKTGLGVQLLSQDRAHALGIAPGNGLLITSVDGSAATRNLRPDYVITSVDGRAATDVTDIAKLLYSKQPGDTVRLGVAVFGRSGFSSFYREGAIDLPIK